MGKGKGSRKRQLDLHEAVERGDADGGNDLGTNFWDWGVLVWGVAGSQKRRNGKLGGDRKTISWERSRTRVVVRENTGGTVSSRVREDHGKIGLRSTGELGSRSGLWGKGGFTDPTGGEKLG